MPWRAFSGEHRVQHRIARLVLGLVVPDLLLHAVQVGGTLGGVRLRPEDGDLVLQVVVLVVDGLDAVPGLAVLGILALEDVLDGVQLPVHIQLAPLDVVGVQHGHPRQIRQGPDVVDIRQLRAGKGSVAVDEAEVAQKEAGQGDEGGAGQLPEAEGGARPGVRPAALQPAHPPEHGGIHRRQDHPEQDSLPHRVPLPAQGIDGIRVELPLQGGGELRQHEGPHRAVYRAGQGHIAAQGDKPQHQPHRRRHAGQPEQEPQAVGEGEEQALDRQPRPQQPPQPEASAPPGMETFTASPPE